MPAPGRKGLEKVAPRGDDLARLLGVGLVAWGGRLLAAGVAQRGGYAVRRSIW